MVDAVLTRQALITGQVRDFLTGRPTVTTPLVSLHFRAEPGRAGRRLNLPVRMTSTAEFAFVGNPLTDFTHVPEGEPLELRLVTRAGGYREDHFDFEFDAAALATVDEDLIIDGNIVSIRRFSAPLLEHIVQLHPLPVHLAGRVVTGDDVNVPVSGAQVRILNVEGVRLVGQLHYRHGADVVAIQDEVEGPSIDVLRDLAVGSRSLPLGTPGSFLAGETLRIRSVPGATEYVTIATSGGLDFREPGLQFPHPQDTTTIHRVTLSDSLGEPVDDRTIDGIASRGSSVIELTNVTGFAAGQVIRIGNGETREYQIVSDSRPFGPESTDENGFFSLRDLPIHAEVEIRVEHEDFAALDARVMLDYRRPVNEQLFILPA